MDHTYNYINTKLCDKFKGISTKSSKPINGLSLEAHIELGNALRLVGSTRTDADVKKISQIYNKFNIPKLYQFQNINIYIELANKLMDFKKVNAEMKRIVTLYEERKLDFAEALDDIRQLDDRTDDIIKEITNIERLCDINVKNLIWI